MEGRVITSAVEAMLAAIEAGRAGRARIQYKDRTHRLGRVCLTIQRRFDPSSAAVRERLALQIGPGPDRTLTKRALYYEYAIGTDELALAKAGPAALLRWARRQALRRLRVKIEAPTW